VQLVLSIDEEKWKKAVFWVFDAPEIANKPFEVSLKVSKLLITAGKNGIFTETAASLFCENCRYNKMH
jgi:hypothetical protein